MSGLVTRLFSGTRCSRPQTSLRPAAGSASRRREVAPRPLPHPMSGPVGRALASLTSSGWVNSSGSWPTTSARARFQNRAVGIVEADVAPFSPTSADRDRAGVEDRLEARAPTADSRPRACMLDADARSPRTPRARAGQRSRAQAVTRHVHGEHPEMPAVGGLQRREQRVLGCQALGSSLTSMSGIQQKMSAGSAGVVAWSRKRSRSPQGWLAATSVAQPSRPAGG